MAIEEGAKPVQVNDPTPKNKSNFYYAAENALPEQPKGVNAQQMIYQHQQQQVGQGAASASKLSSIEPSQLVTMQNSM